MDLNRKYADHQLEVIRASLANNRDTRQNHLDAASTIAAQIERFQAGLGAAASCAWSAAQLEEAGRLALAARA